MYVLKEIDVRNMNGSLAQSYTNAAFEINGEVAVIYQLDGNKNWAMVAAYNTRFYSVRGTI